MRQWLGVLVALSALISRPVRAQSLVGGYWVAAQPAFDRFLNKTVLRIGVIRFDSGGRFTSIGKVNSGPGPLGTLPKVTGAWSVEHGMLGVELCVAPDGALSSGSCHPIQFDGDTGLIWGPVVLLRQDSSAVDVIAPELTRGWTTFYPLAPEDSVPPGRPPVRDSTPLRQS